MIKLERLDDYLKKNQYDQINKSAEIDDTRRELSSVLSDSISEIENNLGYIYNATQALNKEYGSILRANNIGFKSFKIGDVYSIETNIAEGYICIGRQTESKLGNSTYEIDTPAERRNFVSYLLDTSKRELNNNNPGSYTKTILALKTLSKDAYLDKIESLLLGDLKDSEKTRMEQKDKILAALKETLQDFKSADENLNKIQEEEEEEDMER